MEENDLLADTNLQGYLDDSKEVLFCQDDTRPELVLPDLQMKVWESPWTSGHDPWETDVFNFHPPLWNFGDCEGDGPGIWKLNMDDYETIRQNPEHTYAPPFLKAYTAQAAGAAPEKNAPGESARCFRSLMKAIREAK